MSENGISKILVDVFIEVHSQLGPGLLESVYEQPFVMSFRKEDFALKDSTVYLYSTIA